jgi:VWFA-related protein
MRRLALVGLVVVAVLIGPVLVGQKKQRDQEAGSSQKLITLNVSAVEANGERPGDLTEADFQVFEDGKPQKIASFVKNDGKQKAEVKLGPHEFSNHASTAIPHATLILFDLLNDNMGAKGFAWNEIIHTLGSLEHSDYVYLYLLGLDGAFYPVHGLPDAELAKQPDDGSWMRDVKPLLDAAMTKSMRVRPVELLDTNYRVITTLNALGAISSRLAAIPGRKNLVWVSRGIPISIGPRRSYTGDFIDYNPLVQGLATSLERAQIAMYPVDIAPVGMESVPDASNNSAAPPPGAGMGSAETMQQFADLSGGQAFLSNNVREAIKQATGDAHMSYLIGYYSTKPGTDGKYHKIKVTCARKSVKVHSKAGYYAWADAPLSRNQQEATLDSAIGSQFDAAQIGLSAVITPSPKFYSSIHLEISIDRSGLSNPEEGHLLVTLADIHQGGKKGISPTTPLDYKSGTGPIPFPQERTVDGTVESVRVIVMDGRSNAVGTLTVPITKADLSPAEKK